MANQQAFIENIAPFIVREAQARGYKYPAAIIAQACLESAYGESVLAYKYFNYFGLKCGSKWTGRSVNLATKEEYTAGTLTNIRANFRAYDSMEDGVKGYFDFISANRYSNLKSATSTLDYLQKIKADGYATSTNYAANVYNVVTKWGLEVYNNTAAEDPEGVVETVSDEFIRKTAEAVIAGKYGTGAERKRQIGKYYSDVQAKVNELLK